MGSSAPRLGTDIRRTPCGIVLRCGASPCDRLVADGHTVTCLDNLVTGSRANIAGLAGHARFTFIETDVAAAPRMEVDAIFHLASPASPVDYDRLPLETLAANSIGTWRLLEVASAAGAHLTFVSTSEVYGDPLVHPQPETYWGNVDPIGPRACYDEAKRFGEALVTSMRRVNGVRATIVRVFNTYGPRMRRDDGRVVPALVSAALAGQALPLHGDGNQSRSFMYVDDLVEGLIRVGLDPASDGEVFNIGNPHEVTMRELASEVSRAIGHDIPIRYVPGRPGDPRRRRPDITKVTAQYGWEPTISIGVGLARTVAWFSQMSST
jgi:nucleoside-diphosphate-sugar epimerase